MAAAAATESSVTATMSHAPRRSAAPYRWTSATSLVASAGRDATPSTSTTCRLGLAARCRRDALCARDDGSVEPEPPAHHARRAESLPRRSLCVERIGACAGIGEEGPDPRHRLL